jgi:Fe-S cluster biogenesis protein NfuA
MNVEEQMEADCPKTQVSEVLERLRPAMNADGGDIELILIENGIVSIRLKGTCLVCPSASLTIKQGIERTLKQQIPWVREVVRVS